MKKIVQKGNPILRKIAKSVPINEIGKPKINKIIKEMSEALASQEDGVAIAAPQIGYSYRIFLVSKKIFNEGDLNKNLKIEDLVFINPKITKLSKKTAWLSEGCLSVRPYWGEVKRSLNSTVEAYNEKGEKFKRGAGGLLAHIFQHETDHLDGILFVDKAKNIVEGNTNKDINI